LTVFQRTDYLEAAISSVVMQSLTDWECIITDDANTSAAREISARFSEDARIKYRANQTTLGTPLNIAAALSEARGTLLTILNDDDVLYPHMLEHLVTPLEANPHAVAAFGNHEVMDANGVVLVKETSDLKQCRGRNTLKPGIVQDSLSFAVRGGLMVGMGCVFRRSAVEQSWFVREVSGAYDYWLSIKLCEKGLFYFIPENVMSWRQHRNSATIAHSPDKYSAEIYIFNSLVKKRLQPPLELYAKHQLCYFLFMHAQEHLEQGWNTPIARSMLWRSITIEWRFRIFCLWILTFIPAKFRGACIRI
jgi:glycosyltransferase involved in cell wall biosynthesis